MKTKFFCYAIVFIFIACPVFQASADNFEKDWGSNPNIQCLLMQDLEQTDSIENPSHQMSEEVYTVGSKITSNGSSVTFANDSVIYSAEFGFIPLQDLTFLSNGKYADFKYLGKIPFLGEEYYVKDIEADSVTACKGALIDDVSSADFNSGYSGYSFKAIGLTIECDGVLCWVVGVSMTVKKPTGAQVSVNVTRSNNKVVDDIEIRVVEATEEYGGNTTGSIVVYNTSDCVIMADGQKLSIGGQVKNNWLVSFKTEQRPFSSDMSIAEYSSIGLNQKLLKNVTLIYKGSVTLSSGKFLPLPDGYKIVSEGGSVSVQTMTSCNIAGDYPPCGTVTLSEVISMINLWYSSNEELSDVIVLINAWMAS